MREGCDINVGKNVRCRGQWTGRVFVAEQQIGCRSDTQLLAGSCCRDRSPETLPCTLPSNRGRLRESPDPASERRNTSVFHLLRQLWLGFFLVPIS